MAIGYSDNIRSKWVQICTPELLHRAMKSSKVKSVCAQLVDALEATCVASWARRTTRR